MVEWDRVLGRLLADWGTFAFKDLLSILIECWGGCIRMQILVGVSYCIPWKWMLGTQLWSSAREEIVLNH